MTPDWVGATGDSAAVARLKARTEPDSREREQPCDPGAAQKLAAEVFGHGRADDLAHWRGDGATVAIVRGGELGSNRDDNWDGSSRLSDRTAGAGERL